MRRFMILLALLLTFPLYSQWNSLSSLNAVHFYDTNNGWTVGERGKILKSADGGETWIEQSSGTSLKLLSVFATSRNNCFISGESGTLLSTSDGGENWIKFPTNSETTIDQIAFSDEYTGYYIAGKNLYSTIDGGITWNLKHTFLNGVKKLVISDPLYIWTVDIQNKIYKSSDAGSVWAQSFSSSGDIRAFCTPDRYVGYIGFMNDKISSIYRMTNSGGSYSAIKNPDENYSRIDDLFFLDQKNGFAAGLNFTKNEAYISKTTDGGSSWAKIYISTHAYLRDIFFINDMLGWAVGEKGIIMRSTDGGYNWEYTTNIEKLIYVNPIVFNYDFRYYVTKIASGKKSTVIMGEYHQGGENYIPFVWRLSNGKRVGSNFYPSGNVRYFTKSIGFVGDEYCAITYFFNSAHHLDIINLSTMAVTKSSIVDKEYRIVQYKDFALAYTGTSQFQVLRSDGLHQEFYNIPFYYSDVVSDGNFLYFFASGKRILKYDLENEIKLFETDQFYSNISSIGKTGNVYALGSWKAFKLDSNGIKKWEYYTPEFTINGCVEYAEKNIAYVYGTSNYLACLHIVDLETGELIGKAYQRLDDRTAYWSFNMFHDLTKPYMMLSKRGTYPEFIYIVTGFNDPVSDVSEIDFSDVLNYHLYQNYPNPFNPTTQIQYYVPKSGNIKIEVYDILGKCVEELVHGYVDKGMHTAEFQGRGLASGIYFYRIRAGDYVSTRKMILLK